MANDLTTHRLALWNTDPDQAIRLFKIIALAPTLLVLAQSPKMHGFMRWLLTSAATAMVIFDARDYLLAEVRAGSLRPVDTILTTAKTVKTPAEDI